VIKTKLIFGGIFSIVLFFISPDLNAQKFDPSVNGFIADSATLIAFTDVTLIDGTGGPSTNHQTIIIDHGIIKQVGSAGHVKIPGEALVKNCSGKTIIPGMVMLHEHFYYTMLLGNFFNCAEMPFSFPRMYLAGGATTIRTAGSIEPQTDITIRRLVDEGRLIGPDIDVTAPYIERKGWDIPVMFEIKDSAEAAAMVNFYADRGCTSFKMYTHATKEDLIAVVREAHKRKLKVTGHLGTITYQEAAEAGIDDLEHGFFVAADFDHERKGSEYNEGREMKALRILDTNAVEMKNLIRVLVSKHVAVTSTLPVFKPYTKSEIILGGGDSALLPQALKFTSGFWSDAQNKDWDNRMLELYKKDQIWEKQFYDAGGLLVCGTDPTGSGNVLPGYGSRTEIELLVEGGFSVVQAIQIATLNGAKYLEKDKIIGTVEVGKKADLVLINGNLESDIHNIRNTEIVYKNGIGFDSKKIFESVKQHVGMN
jgi:imidazolonepropionase-like amidohydrolase